MPRTSSRAEAALAPPQTAVAPQGCEGAVAPHLHLCALAPGAPRGQQSGVLGGALHTPHTKQRPAFLNRAGLLSQSLEQQLFSPSLTALGYTFSTNPFKPTV